jgi:hypothetical protein
VALSIEQRDEGYGNMKSPEITVAEYLPAKASQLD